MPRQEKVAEVEQLTALVRAASALYFVDFAGLSANDFTDFRRRLRAHRVQVRVVKNRLAIRAMVESGVPSEVAEVLYGPTTIVFAGDDPIAPARLLKDVLGKLKGPRVKGAFLENSLYRSDQFDMLAALPTKEELRMQFVGLLGAPLFDLVLTLENSMVELVRVFDELARRPGQDSGRMPG